MEDTGIVVRDNRSGKRFEEGKRQGSGSGRSIVFISLFIYLDYEDEESIIKNRSSSQYRATRLIYFRVSSCFVCVTEACLWQCACAVYLTISSSYYATKDQVCEIDGLLSWTFKRVQLSLLDMRCPFG